MRSTPDSIKNHIPTLGAAVIFIAALLMFGADTPVFSLFISSLVLLLTSVCAYAYAEMRQTLLVLVMFILWLVFVTLSAMAGYTIGAEEHYLMSLTAIAMFWLGQYSGLTSRGIETAWRLFLMVGLLFSVFAFFQHVYDPGSIFGIEKPYHAGRLTGTFLSSNTAATFLGVVAIAAAAQIYRTWRISYSKSHDSEAKVFLDMLQNTVLPATTFLFAFVSLLLTASRAGIAVTLCIGFLFFLWILSQVLFQRSTFGNIRVGPALLVTVGMVAVFVLFWQMSGQNVSQRYESVFDDVSDRASMLKASIGAYQYKPVFGHGLGSLNEAKLLGMDPIINGSVMSQNASHNFFAQNLVQVGVVGVAVLSLIYSVIVLKILKSILLLQRYTTYLVAIVLISFLVLVHGLFDYALEIPAVMLVHVWLLGLGYGTSLRYAKG